MSGAQKLTAEAKEASVVTCSELGEGSLERLLAEWGVRLVWVDEGADIPASYWGDREAGIQGQTLFVRSDTPVHSALHEACHILCARAAGRPDLDTDAGGEQIEEDSVCYLQIVLSDELDGFSSRRALIDMDAWGYSFRLGSSRAWFERDAEDAAAWLIDHGLLPVCRKPSG